MSKSNPVHLWRFGRTRALFLPQKSLNRAKTGVLNGTPKNFPGPGQGVLTIHKTQLARINWKIKSIFYGLATRGLYFLKKSDAKRPFFPPCRNWPICSSQGTAMTIWTYTMHVSCTYLWYSLALSYLLIYFELSNVATTRFLLLLHFFFFLFMKITTKAPERSKNGPKKVPILPKTLSPKSHILYYSAWKCVQSKVGLRPKQADMKGRVAVRTWTIFKG